MTYWIVATIASTQVELEEISIDFIVGLHRTQLNYDSI
jgi:hypothetical protein